MNATSLALTLRLQTIFVLFAKLIDFGQFRFQLTNVVFMSGISFTSLLKGLLSSFQLLLHVSDPFFSFDESRPLLIDFRFSFPNILFDPKDIQDILASPEVIE